MAEFCTCGSIIINNQCTNKSCKSKTSGKSDARALKAAAGVKRKEAKSTKTRRTSKVITYNLYETKDDSEKEENVF